MHLYLRHCVSEDLNRYKIDTFDDRKAAQVLARMSVTANPFL